MSNLLNFGVPKGSLENATVELFKKAGWQISISSRSYFPGVDDEEMNCKLIRPQEMGKYVERATIDAGEIAAGRDGDLPPRLGEELDGGVFKASLGDAEIQHIAHMKTSIKVATEARRTRRYHREKSSNNERCL